MQHLRNFQPLQFEFQYPQFFPAFAVLIVLFLLFLAYERWKKSTIKRIGDPPLVKELIKNYSPLRFRIKFLLFLLAFAFGILAIANLRKPGEAPGDARKGIDVLFALDVSNSMLATDVEPSRLERAKQMITKLIDQLPNDRIGLIVFSGRAYLQMPLTTDHAAAKLFVTSANPNAAPTQGSMYSKLLQTSSLVFDTEDGRYKTLILVSDGESHSTDTEDYVKDMVDGGIVIHTVGVGTTAGGTIPNPLTGDSKRDNAGNIIVTKLDETQMRVLSEATNGSYFHLNGSEETINGIKQQLSQIEGKAFVDKSQLEYETYYELFAMPMFLLLLAEFFLPERKRRIQK